MCCLSGASLTSKEGNGQHQQVLGIGQRHQTSVTDPGIDLHTQEQQHMHPAV